jgi:hypothetical protein
MFPKFIALVGQTGSIAFGGSSVQSLRCSIAFGGSMASPFKVDGVKKGDLIK